MQKALKMSDALLIERQPLGTGWAEFWTLNAPATRNALTDEMVWALRAACERAQCDTALRAVVLRGAGGHFCAGGSLGSFASAIGRPHGEGIDPLIAVNREFGHLLQALSALPQVLIAAVQGSAMGGGVGLVCCADHVLAATDAQFATPEVTHAHGRRSDAAVAGHRAGANRAFFGAAVGRCHSTRLAAEWCTLERG